MNRTHWIIVGGIAVAMVSIVVVLWYTRRTARAVAGALVDSVASGADDAADDRVQIVETVVDPDELRIEAQQSMRTIEPNFGGQVFL